MDFEKQESFRRDSWWEHKLPAPFHRKHSWYASILGSSFHLTDYYLVDNITPLQK